MSKYLEMLNRKYVLGLISKENLDAENLDYIQALSVEYKNTLDEKGKHQLVFMEKDKNWLIATALLSQLKDIKKSNKTMKGWITFIGVLIIIELVLSFLFPMFI